jgi:hypothetical protein
LSRRGYRCSTSSRRQTRDHRTGSAGARFASVFFLADVGGRINVFGDTFVASPAPSSISRYPAVPIAIAADAIAMGLDASDLAGGTPRTTSSRVAPEPPISLGKSLNVGRPSFVRGTAAQCGRRGRGDGENPAPCNSRCRADDGLLVAATMRVASAAATRSPSPRLRAPEGTVRRRRR